MPEHHKRVGVRSWVLPLMGTFALGQVCAAGEVPITQPPAQESFFPDQIPHEEYQTPRETVRDYPSRAKVEAHYPRPTRSFSLFESLMSYGAACQERCTPRMFSPRGIGHARRTGCERMDYSPYVTTHTESAHGPSYYQRHHVPPCQHPHHCEKRGLHCGWRVYY